MDVKLRILIELLILYSLVYVTGFLNEWLIFFAQLKWSGRVYTLTAVSGLSEITNTSEIRD